MIKDTACGATIWPQVLSLCSVSLGHHPTPSYQIQPMAPTLCSREHEPYAAPAAASMEWALHVVQSWTARTTCLDPVITYF